MFPAHRDFFLVFSGARGRPRQGPAGGQAPSGAGPANVAGAKAPPGAGPVKFTGVTVPPGAGPGNLSGAKAPPGAGQAPEAPAKKGGGGKINVLIVWKDI